MSQREAGHQVTRAAKFAIIPEPVLFDAALSVGARLTWAALARYAGVESEAWPSKRTLARRLGVDRRSVVRWIDELAERGWVIEHERTLPSGASTSSVIELLDAPNEQLAMSVGGEGAPAHPPGAPAHPPGAPAHPHYVEEEKVNEKKALSRLSVVDDRLAVFNHWRYAAQAAGVIANAERQSMRPGRQEKLDRRLREGYTVEQLCAAIDAALASDFHRSDPRWCELTSVLGSREKVERHLAAAEGSTARQSARAAGAASVAHVAGVIEGE